MKTKTTPLFAIAAAALLVANPRAAVAGGEGIAAIGGFIGGMIVGSQVGSTHTHTTETIVVERTTAPAAESPMPQVSEGAVTEAPPPQQTVTTTTETVVTRGASGGYWEERPVQTWVPARWITTHDRYGFPVRHYEPGHYVTHVERVWISGGSAPVVVQPTVVVAPPPPVYYHSYPAVHIGVGYSHYSGYRHYPSYYNRPYYHHRPSYPHHYRSNHVPSHKAGHVKQHLNSHSSGKGLKPKFH